MTIGVVTDLERLTLMFWTLVQRIRRLPMAPATRAMILADVEVLYRRERAGSRGPREQS